MLTQDLWVRLQISWLIKICGNRISTQWTQWPCEAHPALRHRPCQPSDLPCVTWATTPVKLPSSSSIQHHPNPIPLRPSSPGIQRCRRDLNTAADALEVEHGPSPWRSKGGKVEPGSPKFFRHPGLTWPVIHFNQLVDYQISWSKPRKLQTWSLSSNRISQIHIASSTNIEHTQYLWGMKHVHFFKIHGMESELSQIKLTSQPLCVCVNGFCFWLRTQLVFLHNAAEKFHQALQHRKTRLPTQRPTIISNPRILERE